MKKGWEYKKLGEVIEHLRTGLNPRTHFKLNTPDAEGYYVTVRELKGFSIEPDEKTDKVNRAAIKRINERSNLKIGDVLFSGTGTIGKTALVSELPENWNIKEGVYAMTPKHSELDSKYFIYYIGSDLFLRLVNDKAAGTGVRSIPMKELVKLPITIPPLSEQQSIVDYLDSAFAKIDAMKANAEKALNEAKALFQASLKEMLEPKEGWEYKKLGEVCEILDSRRKPITKNKRESGTIPYYGATGILDYVKDYIFDEKLVLLGEDGAKWGAGENSAYIIEGKSWVNNHAHALRPKRDLLVDEILVYYLNFSNLLPYITGVTVPKLNQEKMRSIEIPIGPVKEQQSIVATLDTLKSKVDRLQENYDKISQECEALKQAILRDIFE